MKWGSAETSSSPDWMPVQRAPLIRHIALCAAALLAFIAREHLGVRNSVLWILGVAAVLNLATALLVQRPHLGRLARFLSPAFGVGGWVALMLLSGGNASPFVAGLLLEVILAGFMDSSLSVALTTAAGMAGLWLSHDLAGAGDGWVRPALQAGFLIMTGAVTGYVAGRWRQSREQLRLRHDEIRRRLERLEKDLDDARRLGRMGENVARLAHGFKNTVHSLRGYTRLIEPRLARSGVDRELLSGLTTAIDSLEDLARTTLGTLSPRPLTASESKRENGSNIVSDVIRDVGASFPEVRWSMSLAALSPDVSPSQDVLREVLTIVVRNAAEAVHGQGEVAVEAARQNGNLEIRVRDNGPGLPPSVREAIFQPGVTTKPEGHGLGLFLAHRLLEARGGLLSLSSPPGGGTLCRIALPLTGRNIDHGEPSHSDR